MALDTGMQRVQNVYKEMYMYMYISTDYVVSIEVMIDSGWYSIRDSKLAYVSTKRRKLKNNLYSTSEIYCLLYVFAFTARKLKVTSNTQTNSPL